ncbi:phytoene desaturase [Myxococcota bacterium]|nr:phytoene desaturase [Myxococcota bacterium]
MHEDTLSAPPSDPTTQDSRPHAVVIGSGFGGLAAACRLLARGYRVTVLEKRDQPGGRAYVYRQDGFVFDGGPTVVTAPFMLEELWALFGRKLSDDIDMRPVFPYYRVRFHDGQVFDYQGSKEGQEAEIRKFNPDDVEGYHAFFEMSRKIFEKGFEQLSYVPFGSWMDMLKIAPDMVKLQSYRTVYGLIARYIQDERLRQVFSFHTLLVGGSPFATTSIYSLIAFLERKWGVWFPMGGTGELVKGLVRLIEEQGGQLRLSTAVEQITVEGGRATGVRLVGGEHLAADIVVSNADSAWTYKHLVAPEHRKRWTDRKIEKSRYSMSLFVWYFGTDRKYEDVAHHTILLGPRYKGLIDDIFDKKVLADDFSLYLHRPTATDPSMAPEGCDAFYVLSPVPHLDAGVDWEQQRGEYRQRILRFLSESVMPDLDKHVVSEHILDPLGFQQELSSYKGAAFGLEPVLTQSAYFRPHNKSEEVEGLYLVGAGTHPGAGLPGVLSSAKVLDAVVPDAAQVRVAAGG